MKKIFLLIITVILLFFVLNKVNANEYKRTKLKLIDESKNNQSFYDFRNKLIKIIKNKDSNGLIELFNKEHFHPGFGGGTFEDFINDWNLLIDPENSDIWDELSEVIRLGFYYNKTEKAYVAPAIFSQTPQYIYDKMAPFEWGVIVEKKVNIRKKPSINSKIINQLNYEIVIVDSWSTENLIYEKINNEKFPWYKVYLYNGDVGYVFGKYLRSIGNYRLYIMKNNDKWEIKGFFNGI